MNRLPFPIAPNTMLRAAGPGALRLVAVFAVLAALFGLATLAVGSYEEHRHALAGSLFAEAESFVRQGRTEEALDLFRQAIALNPSELDYRLALALQLATDGRRREAEAQLREVLQDHPVNAEASLARARLAAGEGNADVALEWYQRAIHGAWRGDGAERRRQARRELVQWLERTGDVTRLRSELFALESELPEEAGAFRQLGAWFMEAALPTDAARALQHAASLDPRHPGTYVLLGEALMATGRYAAARTAFRTAVRLDPNAESSRAGLALAQAILALDPRRPGLPASARLERSQSLVERTLDMQERCFGDTRIPPDVERTRQAAEEWVASPRPWTSEGDITAPAYAMARALWRVMPAGCEPKTTRERALARIVTGTAAVDDEHDEAESRDGEHEQAS